jgi:hypothetical protein
MNIISFILTLFLFPGLNKMGYDVFELAKLN